jgi:hypothetical protein
MLRTHLKDRNNIVTSGFKWQRPLTIELFQHDIDLGKAPSPAYELNTFT